MKRTHVIELVEKCQSCNGTGLYTGIGEKDGFAVVCKNCNGKGEYLFRHEYETIGGRVKRTDIKRVLEHNPGIGVGDIEGITESDFGGMSYKDWDFGKPFPLKSEMRRFACPAWWYQGANYKLKPKWEECICCDCFSNCKMFSQKDECWERFDKENKEKVDGTKN